MVLHMNTLEPTNHSLDSLTFNPKLQSIFTNEFREINVVTVSKYLLNIKY